MNWGIDSFQQPDDDNIKPYSVKATSKNNRIKPIPGVMKRSEEEELDKIMKDYDNRKKSER